MKLSLEEPENQLLIVPSEFTDISIYPLFTKLQNIMLRMSNKQNPICMSEEEENCCKMQMVNLENALLEIEYNLKMK